MTSLYTAEQLFDTHVKIGIIQEALREAVPDETHPGQAEASEKHKHHKRFVIKKKELVDVASYADEEEDVDAEEDIRRMFVVRNHDCWHGHCMLPGTCMESHLLAVF